MKTVRLEKDEWSVLSEKAHLVVFNENKPVVTERIDYALVVEDAKGLPMSYTTCRELDSESVYWQYGGSFPGTKGTINSLRTFQSFIRYAKEYGYKRISFYVENVNEPMLKLAMKTGFRITGVRNYKNHVLLEHLLEF